MELKIEDVKIGTKLELVEEELRKATKPFVLGWLDYMRSQEEIIVTGLDGDMLEVNNSDDWGISEDSIGYFKKKEQSQYTFVQLQNLAHKAVIDGVLEYYHVEFYGAISFIKLAFDGKFTHYNSNDAKSGVDFIQSLYKETFMIECEKDIERMIGGCDVTLSNGNKTIAESGIKSEGENKILLRDYKHPVGFFILKGATVTQSK